MVEIRQLRKGILDLLAATSPGHLHVVNIIGRLDQTGDLERHLTLNFSEDDRQSAYIAFEQLRSEGKIAPSMRDSAEPLNWYVIRESGNRERLGVAGWPGEGSIPAEEAEDLTALYRPRSFHRDLVDAVAYAQENESEVGCLMIDLDNFKAINDDYGHAKGDQVLTRVAGCIDAAVKGYGRAYRYGGDEFAALLVNVTRARIEQVAEEIRACIKGLPRVGDHVVSVTIGMATSAELSAADDATELSEIADRRLRSSKRGRHGGPMDQRTQKRYDPDAVRRAYRDLMGDLE